MEGKQIYGKHADIVLSKMTLGWRTVTVPNGNYKIQFVGTISLPGRKDFTVKTDAMSITVKN